MRGLLKRLGELESAVGPSEQTVAVFLQSFEDDPHELVDRWKAGESVEEIQSNSSYRGGEVNLIVFRPVSPVTTSPKV